MRILRILQSSDRSFVELVKEISFLYKSDQETNKKLTLAVQVRTHGDIVNVLDVVLYHLQHHLPDRVLIENNLPVEVVGKFLHSIFEDDLLLPAIRLYAIVPPQAANHSNVQVPAMPHMNKFTLHAVHDFTPLQMLQLILTVFDGVPNSFQIFQCTPNTTEQQLDIFFDRAFHWNDLWYLLLGVNYLRNELQEVYLHLLSIYSHIIALFMQ